MDRIRHLKGIKTSAVLWFCISLSISTAFDCRKLFQCCHPIFGFSRNFAPAELDAIALMHKQGLLWMHLSGKDDIICLQKPTAVLPYFLDVNLYSLAKRNHFIEGHDFALEHAFWNVPALCEGSYWKWYSVINCRRDFNENSGWRHTEKHFDYANVVHLCNSLVHLALMGAQEWSSAWIWIIFNSYNWCNAKNITRIQTRFPHSIFSL